MAKLRLTIEVTNPGPMTKEDLFFFHRAIVDDPDPLNTLLEDAFSLKLENLDTGDLVDEDTEAPNEAED